MEQRPFNFFSCLSLSKISSQLLLSSHTTDPKIQNLNPQKQNHEKILNAVTLKCEKVYCDSTLLSIWGEIMSFVYKLNREMHHAFPH